jgi:hypothetical protein
LAENKDIIKEVVVEVKGEFIALKHYSKTEISEKSVVVVYKEESIDGFVITAFMTSDPDRVMQKGAVVWKKQKN